MRILIIGTTVGASIALCLGLLSGWGLAINVTGGIGIVLLLLAGILTGAFISGDRARANYMVESKENKDFKKKYSAVLFLCGLPFLIIALVIYVLTK